MNFSHLLEVMNYIPNCLLCHGRLDRFRTLPFQIGSSISLEFDVFRKNGYQVMSYVIEEDEYYDIFKIGLGNNYVDHRVERRREFDIARNDTDPVFYRKCTAGSVPPATSGVKFLPLFGSCTVCKKYEYTLQLLINLNIPLLDQIVLNSENFVFEETDGTKKEIKNIYTTQETIYLYQKSSGITAQKNLPLLPLDRDNPNKLLERITNLLPFL